MMTKKDMNLNHKPASTSDLAHLAKASSTYDSTCTEKCEIRPQPMLLKPAIKNYLWGGTRLRDDFGKACDTEPLAESWECSTHPDGLSVVASSWHEGRTLRGVLKEHPEYLGEGSTVDAELPFLVKFIDAHRDLSVQVHPDDEYAFSHENGARGKTEFWYVVDAKPDAKLVYGFHRALDKAFIERSIAEKTIEKYLNKVPVSKGDIFFITPGTVHAIGAGTVIVEIQQSSNITYRLYDYDRVDKQGNKRELHVTKALDVINPATSLTPTQPMRTLNYRPGSASELLVRCRWFSVERYIINTQQDRDLVTLHAPDTYFVIVCIDGCGTLHFDDDTLPILKGDSVFVPARVQVMLHGKMEFLKIYI